MFFYFQVSYCFERKSFAMRNKQKQDLQSVLNNKRLLPSGQCFIAKKWYVQNWFFQLPIKWDSLPISKRIIYEVDVLTWIQWNVLWKEYDDTKYSFKTPSLEIITLIQNFRWLFNDIILHYHTEHMFLMR